MTFKMTAVLRACDNVCLHQILNGMRCLRLT